MAQDIKPTRSELLKVKKQIKLAKSGYSLLKKKRDGLILEFFEVLKKAKTLREELVAEYKIAVEKMNIARAIEGDLKVKSIAMAIKQIPDITLITKNIMGVKVPKIEGSEIKKAFMERGYGVYNSSAAIARHNQKKKLIGGGRLLEFPVISSKPGQGGFFTDMDTLNTNRTDNITNSSFSNLNYLSPLFITNRTNSCFSFLF